VTARLAVSAQAELVNAINSVLGAVAKAARPHSSRPHRQSRADYHRTVSAPAK
jgi:hypothetical protein